MITNSYDDKSQAIISPQNKDIKPKCDVIIATFSNLI